jgi:hypothetical protein
MGGGAEGGGYRCGESRASAGGESASCLLLELACVGVEWAFVIHLNLYNLLHYYVYVSKHKPLLPHCPLPQRVNVQLACMHC